MSGTWGMIGGTLVGQGSGGAAPLLLIQASGKVTVTAHATAHTKGAWTELIASTTADANQMALEVSGISVSATNTATLIDLAQGAAGSETPILSDLPVGSAFANFQVPLPASIPAGTRLSARIQSAVTGGKTATVSVAALSGGVTPGAMTVLGADVGASKGTSLSSDAWTEIIPSTAVTYRYLIPIPSASTTSLNVSSSDYVTLGSGEGGSETEVGRIAVRTEVTERVLGDGAPWSTCGILPGVPAGTRLVLKRGATHPGGLDGVIIGVE